MTPRRVATQLNVRGHQVTALGPGPFCSAWSISVTISGRGTEVTGAPA